MQVKPKNFSSEYFQSCLKHLRNLKQKLKKKYLLISLKSFLSPTFPDHCFIFLICLLVYICTMFWSIVFLLNPSLCFCCNVIFDVQHTDKTVVCSKVYVCGICLCFMLHFVYRMPYCSC